MPVFSKRGHPPVKVTKAAREQDGSEGKVHNSGVYPYTSQILQLEERPWPVNAAVKQCESLPGLKIGVPPPLFSTREGGPPVTCGTIRRAA